MLPDPPLEGTTSARDPGFHRRAHVEPRKRRPRGERLKFGKKLGPAALLERGNVRGNPAGRDHGVAFGHYKRVIDRSVSKFSQAVPEAAARMSGKSSRPEQVDKRRARDRPAGLKRDVGEQGGGTAAEPNPVLAEKESRRAEKTQHGRFADSPDIPHWVDLSRIWRCA
ncbi:hypothetical protein SCH01S_01_00100 [Sphingomonas changbaiensis NBRC 104936]|uniref:Uncharacterized protein n=1 Tax=Sphingomonas changbaiensis NBRC 104936 TaxID=1219043 RepID=A0A0E9MJ34_9SPHN|nr:hypothetical protein SCH01S_01_00100 [Sphingomonas changbaiensis NBRC 104936]